MSQLVVEIVLFSQEKIRNIKLAKYFNRDDQPFYAIPDNF